MIEVFIFALLSHAVAVKLNQFCRRLNAGHRRANFVRIMETKCDLSSFSFFAFQCRFKRFDGAAFGNVTNRGSDEDTFVGIERTQIDFSELLPSLRLPESACSHQTRARVGKIALLVCLVLFLKAWGRQHGDRLSITRLCCSQAAAFGCAEHNFAVCVDVTMASGAPSTSAENAPLCAFAGNIVETLKSSVNAGCL